MMFITYLLLFYVNAVEDRGSRPNAFNLLCKINNGDVDYFTEVDAFATLGSILTSVIQPSGINTHRNISQLPLQNTVNVNITDGDTNIDRDLENGSMLVIITTVTLFLVAINVFLTLMLYIRPMISPSLYIRANDAGQFETCQQSTQI